MLARQSSTLPGRAFGCDSRAPLTYLHAYETVSQAREGISRYVSFFNAARPHTAHGGSTPDSAYYASLPAMPKAA